MGFPNLINSLLFMLIGVSVAVKWQPQRGTISNPRLPQLSPQVRTGDYYMLYGELYRALVSADLNLQPQLLTQLPDTVGHKSDTWQHIPRGSYIHPKRFGEDRIYEGDDVFYDAEDQVYYQAVASGTLGGHWYDEVESSIDWVELEVNADWMTLLRPIIGDYPLGDVLIPGCHDAGTWGINEDSILVDKNFLFNLAMELTPETVANWSITQGDKFDLQLTSGFRNLDLRVADVDQIEPGVFRWYHGMASDDITEGLQHIGDFARTHPEEILVLDLQHFAAPGNSRDPTLPIPEARKDVLSDMILAAMGDRMAPRGNLPSNPTMNQVLSSGGNIIAIMKDDYIRAKDDRYWSSIIHSSWVGVANPEDLFNERSAKLRNYQQLHRNEMTDISGCVTPDERIVVAGLVTVYGDNETLRDILEEILPQLIDVQPANMSFEGLWVDLFTLGEDGTNTAGMRARDPEFYSNGASVHYDGTNAQLRHWVARPNVYKPNIIYTDSFLTSTIVDTAIEYNSGDIPREVSVAHQGNPMNGFYTWNSEGWSTIGGQLGLECIAVDVQWMIKSLGAQLDTGIISQTGLLDIQDGTYPPGSTLELSVRSSGSLWQPLWSADLQQLIDDYQDVYVRGTDTGSGSGFAYVSSTYNDFGVGCNQQPADHSNILATVQW